MEGIDEVQVQKAVVALLKYIGKEKQNSTNLLEDEELLYLVSWLRLHFEICLHLLQILAVMVEIGLSPCEKGTGVV